MLKSYFTIALRNLWRNRSFSGLNIAGLTIGIAVFLLIFEYTQFEKSSNRFHKNYNSLFRLAVNQPKENNTSYYIAPGYASVLKNGIPGIDACVRIAEGLGAGVIQQTAKDVTENSFRAENVIYADNGFFDIFSFPLITGNGSLQEPKTMVINESIALKIFKSTDIIGESMTMNNQFGKTDYRITGVFKDIASTSDIRTDIVLSLNTLASAQNRDGNDWADPATLESGFTTLYLKLNKVVSEESIASSITTLYRKTKKEKNKPTSYYSHLNTCISLLLWTTHCKLMAALVLFGRLAQ